MKKFTRILCITLSMIMVVAVIATAAACPDETNTTTITVTYYNGNTKLGEFKMNSGESITNVNMPSDPEPEETTKFLFWSDKKDGTSDYIASSKPTKDVTLYSIFGNRAENEVVVTFNSEGGSRVASQVITRGGSATEPTKPTLSGATFRNWKNSKKTGAFNFSTVINEDIVLLAVWNEGENKVLVMSSGDLDKVFSPFFSTSGDDVSVYAQTQVSMLSSDAEGNVYVGEDVPSVVKSFNYNTYVDGELDNDGRLGADLTEEQKKDPDMYHTEYKFVVKNGIKLSDGVTPLTIKDILFNMYVYLDPVYTGSNTMYSTQIVGLSKYRTQNPDATGDENDSKAIQNARNRTYGDIGRYYHSTQAERDNFRNGLTKDQKIKILKDVQTMREFFWKELKSDWSNVLAIEDIAEDYKEFGFTQPWEVFLYNCGSITVDFNADGTVNKNSQKLGYENGINYGNTKTWLHDSESLLRIIFNNKAGVFRNDTEAGNIYQSGQGTPNIDLKFDATGNITGNIYELGDSSADWTKLLYRISESTSLSSDALELLYGWQCGSQLYTDVLAEEKSNLITGLKTDDRFTVETIDGITVTKLRAGDEFVDQEGETQKYDEDHYVLNIDIIGVDPKALWNFGFYVAPMSYYSNPVGKSDTSFGESDGYRAFNYPGLDDYVSTKPTHLGFGQFDSDYFKEILKHPDIISLPYGAGPFAATDSRHTEKIENVSATGFYDNGIVYFRRNNYFDTTGAAMSNVRFQYMNFKVIETSKVMDELISEGVHVGDPNAKEQNVTKAERAAHLNHELIMNNGYGYVGINAAFVPDIQIRQAIMYALNTNLIKSYYVGTLAESIARPMSKTNWAYPHGAPDAYPYSSDALIIKKIQDLVAEAGYDGSKMQNKALARVHETTGQIIDLSFVFTVAGSSTDHPAYQMFESARVLLNKCGFNVTVKNDSLALAKLSNGLLEVWAAAWTTAIDPDMYQLYHKKSQAQAVKNWGYPYLYDQGLGTDIEKGIIDELAKQIENGRSTLDQNARKDYYATALNLVMDLAVEYPIYQRKNLTVYNKNKIDSNSVNQNPTTYSGLFDYIWKIRLI